MTSVRVSAALDQPAQRARHSFNRGRSRSQHASQIAHARSNSRAAREVAASITIDDSRLPNGRATLTDAMY
jgi:hypothetical protein